MKLSVIKLCSTVYRPEKCDTRVINLTHFSFTMSRLLPELIASQIFPKEVNKEAGTAASIPLSAEQGRRPGLCLRAFRLGTRGRPIESRNILSESRGTLIRHLVTCSANIAGKRMFNRTDRHFRAISFS
jgi:hypothetical protein